MILVGESDVEGRIPGGEPFLWEFVLAGSETVVGSRGRGGGFVLVGNGIDVVGCRRCGGARPGGDWDVMGSRTWWGFVLVGIGT